MGNLETPTPETPENENLEQTDKKIEEDKEQIQEISKELKNLAENVEQTIPIITENFAIAVDNLSEETKKIIKDVMNIPDNQEVTAASIKVSAGADSIRWKNFINAQKKYAQKIEILKTYEKKIGKNNIGEIIKETDQNMMNISKEQENQVGNRYLIGARIVEGFIQSLENLSYDEGKKPDITLIVDREKCLIGTTGDNANDRNIKIQIKLTTEPLPAGSTKQKKSETDDTNNEIGTQNNEQETVVPTKPLIKETPTQNGKGPNGSDIEIKELDETFQIKEDIARQFTFNGNINTQDVGDILPDPTDKNIYTATINGYADFKIKYEGDTIEIVKGTVKKGLLKRDIKETENKVKIDRISKQPEKKNISVALNTKESFAYINTKLLTTTPEQGNYQIKNESDVTESAITIVYKNPDVVETKDEKPFEDQIIIKLDKDFLIAKDQQNDMPLTRQKINGTKEGKAKGNYQIDNKKDKLTYYAKTENGTKNPKITIANNIVKYTETENTTIKSSIFPEYTNQINQKKTTEMYSEKVQFQYDTPEVTRIEKIFKQKANIEYKDDQYVLHVAFDVINKNAPIIMEVPVNYIPGTKENNNTSTVVFQQPELNIEDDYNQVLGNNKVMIDGVVYNFGTANTKQKGIPNIIFRHDTEATLKNTKEWTSEYTTESNIFSKEKTVDEETQGYENVNAGLDECQFGTLKVKDNNREEPITYYQDVYVGQVKKNNRIILQGTKIGTMYFDQHGKFLEYTTNTSEQTFANQTEKADLINHTPIAIKEPIGQPDKNILLTTTYASSDKILHIDILNPDATYNGTTTGKDFIKEQKSTTDKFYKTIDINPIIAENRITIYEALKKISSDDVDGADNIFNLVTERAKDANVVLGPDRKGVYAYQIVKGTKGFPDQYMYAKVVNGKITLCNDKGESLTEQKIIIGENNDFYKITVEENDNIQQFKISGIEKEKEKRLPTVEVYTDKKIASYLGDLTTNRTCTYRSRKQNDINAYQFSGKNYLSFNLESKDEENTSTIEGESKITNVSDFSLVDANEEGFGSYKDFFVTKYQKALGIDEKTYEKVFKSLYKEENTDNLIRVKYQKDNRFYYAPMYANIENKGNQKTVKLTPSPAWSKAVEEMEKRLELLTRAYSVFLEQDLSTKIEGDSMFGWYLVKPTPQNKNEFFENPSTSIKLLLQTNNKIGDSYQKQEIIFDPIKESIDKKEITINNIKYSITLASDEKVGYKIIIKKGDVVTQTKEVTPKKTTQETTTPTKKDEITTPTQETTPTAK